MKNELQNYFPFRMFHYCFKFCTVVDFRQVFCYYLCAYCFPLNVLTNMFYLCCAKETIFLMYRDVYIKYIMCKQNALFFKQCGLFLWTPIKKVKCTLMLNILSNISCKNKVGQISFRKLEVEYALKCTFRSIQAYVPIGIS